MNATLAAKDDDRFTENAGRMLSGMIILTLMSAGTAAFAFGVACLVLMMHRERLDSNFTASVVSGLFGAVCIWGLLYCRSTQFRLLFPLW